MPYGSAGAVPKVCQFVPCGSSLNCIRYVRSGMPSPRMAYEPPPKSVIVRFGEGPVFVRMFTLTTPVTGAAQPSLIRYVNVSVLVNPGAGNGRRQREHPNEY